MTDKPALIRENTTGPVPCKAKVSYWRFNEPTRELRSGCRLFTPHDGPHKTYIEGIGWYAFDDARARQR